MKEHQDFHALCEAVLSLTREEQERLLRLLSTHLKQCGREDVCRDIAEARVEQRKGGCCVCDPDDLMQDILE